MPTSRLEAFSDGVLAIIITIMVLELRVPGFVAICWNNHHHLMTTADHVSGPIMWANMHLLFRLSLVPFSTSWLGESHGAAAPAAFYGLILLMAGVAYFVLSRMIIRESGADGALAVAVPGDEE